MPARMFFQPKEFSNELTAIIEKDNPTVETVLSNSLLSTTVRNEALKFLNFFFDPNELTQEEANLENLDRLLDLALNPNFKLNNKDLPNDVTNNIFQINRNAANVLSSPGKKFRDTTLRDPQKRIFRRLRNFINEDYAVTNSMYAGHFQRIFENFFRNCEKEFLPDKEIDSFYDDDFSMKNLIEFLIENVNILPYRELLSHLITDFAKPLAATAMEATHMILETAGRHIFSIQAIKNMKQEKVNEEENQQHVSKDDNKFEGSYNPRDYEKLKKIQPVGLLGSKIKMPTYFTSSGKKSSSRDKRKSADGENSAKCESIKNKSKSSKKNIEKKSSKRSIPNGNIHESKLTRSTDNVLLSDQTNLENLNLNFKSFDSIKFLKKMQKAVDFSEVKVDHLKGQIESLHLKAYYLIMVIKYAITDDSEFYNLIRDDDSIKILLICATFSEANSRMTTEAFNVAKLVIYGNEKVGIEPLKVMPDFVKDFAEYIDFDPTAVTQKMLAALPIFWNCRSAKYGRNDISTNYPAIDINDYPLILKEEYKKPVGKTPLEVMTPVFFTEPPISDQFNNNFLDILKKLAVQRSKLVGDDISKVSSPEVIKDVLKIDKIYIEFMRNRFDFLIGHKRSPSKKYCNLHIATAIEAMLEKNPTSDYWQTNDDAARAAANGHILELAHWSMNARFLEIGKNHEISAVMHNLPPPKAETQAAFLQTTYDMFDLMDRYNKKLANIELDLPPLPSFRDSDDDDDGENGNILMNGEDF